MRRTFAVLAVTASAATAAACGGASPDRPGAPPPVPAAQRLTAAQAHPDAPRTAGALQRIADVAPARERLAFADLQALRTADLPVSPARLLRSVLGASGAATATAVTTGTVVQVGDAATVLDGGAAARRIHGATGALARALDTTRPQRSAITPPAPSAAQSCLGTTLAQTILGPETMGADAALGVGLAVSGDAPAGLQLRICAAPHYLRHLHAMQRTLTARFGTIETADGRRPAIGEQEIGEREIVSAVLPADAIAAARLLDLLAGDRALRALAW